jgi:hypothetical protein
MSYVVAPFLMTHTYLLMVCACIRLGTCGCVSCMCACVESPHRRSVLNFENYKYTNRSPILITLNCLETKFNDVLLSCQSYVLIVFITLSPGYKPRPVGVVFFVSSGV